MKKLIITAAIAAIFSVTAFANDGGRKPVTGEENVTYVALNHFNADYKDAKDAAWTVTSNTQKVNFTIDGKTMTAFYSLAGDYMGTTRSISINAVSAEAKKDIAAHYAGYNVTGVIEFTNIETNTTVRFVDVTKADSELVLKVTSDNVVSYFKTVK